jgi:hypothetical protein
MMDNEGIKLTIDILHFAGADTAERIKNRN